MDDAEVARADLADLRAQWRPLLVPTGEPTFRATGAGGRAAIPVQNTGRGPALYVRAILDPANQSPDDWSLGAISPNEVRTLEFSNLGGINLNYQLLLDYRDLAGRLYSSAIIIDRPGGRDEARFYDVKVFADKALTGLGESQQQQDLRELPKQSDDGA